MDIRGRRLPFDVPHDLGEECTAPTVQKLRAEGKLHDTIYKLKCPHCGNEFYAAHISGQASKRPNGPIEGDPGCCIACGEFMFFHDGEMKKPTPEETEALLDQVPLAKKISHEIKTQNIARNN